MRWHLSVNQYDLGWLVAFYEGEGSVWAGRSGSGVGSMQFRLHVTQKDPEPLRHFGSLVQCGRFAKASGKNPCANWIISGREGVVVAMLLRPHLSLRRQLQLDKAIATWGSASHPRTEAWPKLFVRKAVAG